MAKVQCVQEDTEKNTGITFKGMYLSPLDTTRATRQSCPYRETIDISTSCDTCERHQLRAHGKAIVNVIPWQLKLSLMQYCM